MPASTPKGYPYPVGSDLVVNGDTDIQALAEAITARLARRIQSGSASTDATGVVHVTFPVPFESGPAIKVVAQLITTNASRLWAVGSVNTTGFDLYCKNRSDGSLAGGSFNWIAMQTD